MRGCSWWFWCWSVVSFLRLEGCLVAVSVLKLWMELAMDWNGRERIVLEEEL